MTIAHATKAYNIILAKGRMVDFVKLDRTVDDSAKPWRGTADADATPEAQVSYPVVAVPPTGVVSLGLSMASAELLKRSEQILIAATGPTSTDDLEEFDEVWDDDGTTWKIVDAQVLRHDDGPRILYYVGVRR